MDNNRRISVPAAAVSSAEEDNGETTTAFLQEVSYASIAAVLRHCDYTNTPKNPLSASNSQTFPPIRKKL